MIPATSSAAVLTDFGKALEIFEVPVPHELEPGAVLVKTLAATICASDIHMTRGHVDPRDSGMVPPLIPGHEMSGEVVAMGAGVDRDSVGSPLAIGDRIVWAHGFCGQCYPCVAMGEPTLCAHRRGYMSRPYIEYPHLTGGFSEYCYVYPTSGRVKIPDGVSSEVASASSCALRTVIHGFNRLGDLEDKVVVVQGSGPLGLFSLTKALSSNARQVIVIGGPASRLALASEWGASATLDVMTTSAEERDDRIKELTGGWGADVVIEVSGAARAFGEGVPMLARGGRYLLMGSVSPAITQFDARWIILRQLTLMGGLSGHVADYYHALQFMVRERARFDWGRMITSTYDLADINVAMDAMEGLADIKPAIRF